MSVSMSCIFFVVRLAFGTATRILQPTAQKWRCMSAKFEFVIYIIVKCYKNIYLIADYKFLLIFI